MYINMLKFLCLDFYLFFYSLSLFFWLVFIFV